MRHKRLASCYQCGTVLFPGRMRCTSCGQWNFEKPRAFAKRGEADGTVLLSDANTRAVKRLRVGVFDAAFGGGILTGGVTLLGGTSGAGKTTMVFQLFDHVLSEHEGEVLFCSAEESEEQVRGSTERLNLRHASRIRLVPMLGGFHGDLGGIIESRKPIMVVVDSLPQLVEGDLEDAVAMAGVFKEYATKQNAPFVLIDHMTKSDDLAGLERLQHVVDTTMVLRRYEEGREGRRLTTRKNRFGPDHEECLVMTGEKGLAACEGCAECTEEEDEEEGSHGD